MITDTQIEKFRILYKTRFGSEISREEARERGLRLIALVKAIYKPITIKKTYGSRLH